MKNHSVGSGRLFLEEGRDRKIVCNSGVGPLSAHKPVTPAAEAVAGLRDGLHRAAVFMFGYAPSGLPGHALTTGSGVDKHEGPGLIRWGALIFFMRL